MKHLFKPETVKYVTILLAIILFVKFVWVAVTLVWLPTTGVEYSEDEGPKKLYYRVKLASQSATSKGGNQQTVKPTGPKASIKDIDLLAIYSASDITVVTIKHKNKTKVLSTGEEINGFILESAASDFATFSKNGKLYKVTLLEPKKTSRGTGSIKNVTPLEPSGSMKEEKNISGDIVDTGDQRIIDKSLVSHYATHMDDIFKDIGIRDMKQGDKLTGFQVSFVRRGSHFAKLGLQKGDIIKAMNGQEIKSYNTAFDMYKKIQSIDNVTLVIQRDNKEMELEYEVN